MTRAVPVDGAPHGEWSDAGGEAEPVVPPGTPSHPGGFAPRTPPEVLASLARLLLASLAVGDPLRTDGSPQPQGRFAPLRGPLRGPLTLGPLAALGAALAGRWAPAPADAGRREVVVAVSRPPAVNSAPRDLDHSAPCIPMTARTLRTRARSSAKYPESRMPVPQHFVLEGDRGRSDPPGIGREGSRHHVPPGEVGQRADEAQPAARGRRPTRAP